MSDDELTRLRAERDRLLDAIRCARDFLRPHVDTHANIAEAFAALGDALRLASEE